MFGDHFRLLRSTIYITLSYFHLIYKNLLLYIVFLIAVVYSSKVLSYCI